MALVSIKSWPLTAVNLLQFCYDKNTKTLPKTNQLRPGNFGNTLHSHRSTMKSLRKIDMWVDSKGLNNHYWTVLNHSTKAGYEKALIFFFTRVKMIWREIIYIICEILQRQRNWTSSKVEDNSGRRLKQNNTIMCKQIKKKKGKSALQFVARPELSPRKVTLCVSWSWKGLVHCTFSKTWSIVSAGILMDGKLNH